MGKPKITLRSHPFMVVLGLRLETTSTMKSMLFKNSTTKQSCRPSKPQTSILFQRIELSRQLSCNASQGAKEGDGKLAAASDNSRTTRPMPRALVQGGPSCSYATNAKDAFLVQIKPKASTDQFTSSHPSIRIQTSVGGLSLCLIAPQIATAEG